uniref:LAM_G_DOMAIN domain-containing protein n=1 Tax=Steinernema glaseri TaxID=37863 RepID=A0A1I8ALN0_9BILA
LWIAIAICAVTVKPNDEPPLCEENLEGRIAAGFYKNALFYFAYDANETTIDLDPETLFGDAVIPEKTNYTVFRLVPVNDNRVVVFFEESKKFFYAFYELDDLTAHMKNGSARVLQSLDSQEKYEVKYTDGSVMESSQKKKSIQRTNDKLILNDKELSGFSEIKLVCGPFKLFLYFPYF